MWSERWSVCAEHKDTNWPEAQLHKLFSQEFMWGRARLKKGKVKSFMFAVEIIFNVGNPEDYI